MMKKYDLREIYDRDYAQNYNQRFLLNDLSKIDADFERETIAQLLDEIGDHPRWLDVACGTGYFLSCFPEVERAGLDISPAMLETARQANPNIPLIQGDYREKRPQWESKWDLISCMFWAYCYVESFSELELVVANFANWTSERGVCFLPVCDPAELRHGEIVLPYTSRNMGAGGGLYRFEGIIWSWIDEEFGKHHLNLIVPQPEYMLSLFGKFFEDVKIINYAIFNGAQRRAIVARSKKRRTNNPKVNLNIQKLVRSQEWWLYKIAPLLTIAYAETLLLQLPPTTATLTTLTALLSITSVAAYGYLLNDICDIESDQKANKSNAAAQLQPWQRLLLCLLFLSIGFAAPLLTHLGTIPLALLAANYLLPTLYSVPPLRLKERGIWGILSDAAGAHLVPTLFVAATVLSHTPDASRNALLFTGVAATHAFLVGLRGILLHQLWDRANDLNAGITTFVTQQPPETVQQWINRLVFPVELLLLGGVALLLCQSTPALTAFFAVYLLLTAVNVKTAPRLFTPCPPKGQNIIPHDLYEVWLPLALAITLAVQNPQFLIFVALTAILFYPSLKVRTTELFHVIKAGFTPMPNPTPPTAEAPRPTPTNVAPLTPEMQQQLETEGYVVLENFLTPDELEDLREFDSTHPLPEDITNGTTINTSDRFYRQQVNQKLISIVNPKLATLLPGYRTAFCTWYRKSPNSSTNATPLHHDPSHTSEPDTLSFGIWFPLMDVDPGNSCLHVIKGSHHLNSQPRPFYPFIPFSDLPLPDSEKITRLLSDRYLAPIPLKAGQAILYDKRLIHSATANLTPTERIACTCIISPVNEGTQIAYMPATDSPTLEIYEVDDEFYNHHIYGDRPHGDGVKLIKTEPYSYNPLTPELIAEKLDPLHPDQAISRLKTQLSQTQTEMQQQLETEGYVVLENFLTPDELEDLREFDRAHPLPEDLATPGFTATATTSDRSYRKIFSDKFKAIATSKLSTTLPGYRAVFSLWFRKKSNSGDNSFKLHQGPYLTDESRYPSLGIWCPLTDVDVTNGCLYVVKGSHRLNLQKRAFYFFTLLPYGKKELSCMEDNYLTPIPLKAGQAILFDKKLFHGSTANTSDTDRIAVTCFILIPNDAPLYFCYRESEKSENVEIYEVPEDFYDRYILGEKPQGDGVTLIKTEPYTYDPLTPELIAEKLDPLHREKSTQPEAIEQYRQTLQHFQTQAQQHFQQLQNQLHQTQSELNQLKTYLQQTQGTAGLFNYYRHCINHQPDNLDLYQKALTLQPDNLELRLQLGQTLTQQNRPEEAITTYQTALESHPHWQLYLALGQTLEQVKRDAEAITAYERAIQLNPHHSPIYEHLGDLLAEQNQLSAASQYYRRVLELQQGRKLPKADGRGQMAEGGKGEVSQKKRPETNNYKADIVSRKKLDIEKYLSETKWQIEVKAMLYQTYYNFLHQIEDEKIPKEEIDNEIQDHVFRRYQRTLTYYLPWVTKVLDLSDKEIIEIGCGTGSSTAAFAHFSKHIYAYEVDQTSALAARERMKIMGINNVSVIQEQPESLLETIKSNHSSGVSVILLFAVLEHTTIQERLDTLKLCWELLLPGGILIIAETPNRLTYYDYHTSRLPFFHFLPLDLAVEYYNFSPREQFKLAIEESLKSQTQQLAKNSLIRWGNAVSYHEFELALGSNLEELLVADGDCEEMRQLYPVSKEEELLRQYFIEANIKQPLAFTNQIFNLIFKKKKL